MLAALSLAALSLTACSGPTGLAEEDIATVQQAIDSENGLSNNGLSNNGLSNNGLSNNGLSNNGLSNNGLVMAQLSQATAREFLTYVVSCALPAGQNITLTINNTPVLFQGGLGLAPEWGDDNGSCDATCQAWVSGCLMARVNKLGDHVAISLRGDAPIHAPSTTSPLVTTTTEQANYTLREGAYYGNVFADPQILYACTEHNSPLIGRVCGYVNNDPSVPDVANCIMTVVGDCQDFCTIPAASDPPNPSVDDGRFLNCRSPGLSVQVPYPGTVTVYRQPPPP